MLVSMVNTPVRIPFPGYEDDCYTVIRKLTRKERLERLDAVQKFQFRVSDTSTNPEDVDAIATQSVCAMRTFDWMHCIVDFKWPVEVLDVDSETGTTVHFKAKSEFGNEQVLSEFYGNVMNEDFCDYIDTQIDLVENGKAGGEHLKNS